MNGYRILKLDPNSSQKEIKKRYKEMAKLYHPDNSQTGNLHKFHEVSQAYASLTLPRVSDYYYPKDPVFYKTRFTQRYAKNSTFISVLAACVVLVGAFDFFYLHSSHSSFIQAADRHHLRSSLDLQKARTEAKLFGNQKGIQRVLDKQSKKDCPE